MDEMWQHLPALLRKPELLIRGFKYLQRLKRARVPFLKSHVLTSIKGDKVVQQAVLSEIDSSGRLIPGQQKTFDADTVCLGYGLIPHTGLTRLIGCNHIYNALLGGWIPKFDANMQTDQDGVFVAGDGAGVAGVLVASEQGKLAGLCAAAYVENIPTEKFEMQTKKIRNHLSALQKFRRTHNLNRETFFGGAQTFAPSIISNY